jgi:kynureninase
VSERDDPLLAHRPRFPILARTNYLISNSLGAVPADAEKALHDYYETWATRGVRAWEETWWTMAADLGDRLAPLIGAGPGEVVFQPNVTIAHAVVFSAFRFPSGRPKIVTDAMHFPSVLYLIDQQAGAEVVVVPTDDGVTIDTGRLVEAIDERTAFVNVSHVVFKSSYIHEVASIAERARSVGAVSIVDGYQSVGSIPVDVQRLGVEVYIGGCLKWLCGGPGAAFVWVRPELRASLAPRLTGWMAHARPFAFAPTLDRRDDAWRYLTGTPNIAAFHAARPGIDIIREVGIDAIRSKSVRQTERLLGLASERDWRVTTPPDPSSRGGTVAIDVEHGREVSKALKAREVLCDYRPGAGVRLSPHFYTSDDELEAAISAMGEIIDGGSWRDFLDQESVVT